MIASILVTILVVPAVLLLLANAAMTEGYTAKVPGGSAAMGLVVPFFIAIGSGLALVVAAWACTARGGLGWLGVTPGYAAVIATGVSLGVGLAAFCVLIAWAERAGAWVSVGGIVLGVLGPMCLGGLLLAGAWVPQETMAASPVAKVAGGFVSLVAVVGIVMGMVGGWMWASHQAANERAVAAQRAADDARWAKERAKPPMEKLRDGYAQASESTPLWWFIAELPDRQERDCRAFIIERALKVPEFEQELERTMTDVHPRYRHGCADLVRFAPAERVKPEWGAALLKAITITAGQIRSKPTWLVPDDFANPYPAEHVRAMVEASARVGDAAKVRRALAGLREAIEQCPAGPERDEALAVLGAEVVGGAAGGGR